MRTWWKFVIGLAVALPMLAYVAGTLAASGDEPAPRAPIVLEESVDPAPSATPSSPTKPTTGPTTRPTPQPTRKATPSAKPTRTASDRPETITPSPDDLDDDDDNEGRDDDDDNSGPGGDDGHDDDD